MATGSWFSKRQSRAEGIIKPYFSPWRGADATAGSQPTRLALTDTLGCLIRSVHGTFPEYHTSADNPDSVKPEALDQSYAVVATLFDLLDANRTYVRTDMR
jgi:aminopeptidase-like protein